MLIILHRLIEHFELDLNMFFKKSNLFFTYTLIILISSGLYAEEYKSNAEIKIIEKISTSFFSGQKVTAWGENSEHKNIIKQSTKFNAIETPDSARLLIVSKTVPQNLAKNSVIIAMDYSLLEKDDRIIGALFWQKGRPNLIFIRERMKRNNLTLSPEFDKYIEESL